MQIDVLVGSIAAVCTTTAFLPQTIHILKHRNTAGISVAMYTIFSVGVAFWLAYGLILMSWPVIIANAITLMLSLAILGMKLFLRQHPPLAAPAEPVRPQPAN
jgi:MtN3 and saliva related transmembrane protein